MMLRSRYETLVDMLEARASEGDARGFTFLDDGETDGPRMSFADLAHRARALAAVLQERGLAGERVLLMYPPGLDFIVGFFGCLCARAVAVPVYPPDPTRLERSLPRLEAVAVDADAAALLSTEAVLALADEVIPLAPGLAGVQRIAGDTIDLAQEHAWRRPRITPDALAFLQYTSGSTSLPKGVMVRHAELLHNEAQIEAALRRDRDARSVNWLPMFHDMGLIGAVLQPVYSGADAWLMSPLDFLARPIRWLQAISRVRGYTCAAPNFAYELCARKVSEAEAATLDLRSWRFALSGAEPVRADTLDRFAARFAVAGFAPESFYPCYGLAEATLFVTGGAGCAAPRRLHLDPAALAEGTARDARAHDAKLLVSCGHAWSGTTVAVVDPGTGTRLPDDAVGEVWVRGATVAQGYFRRDEESARVFGAALDGEGAWLRTGDLGFVRDGELYITGRLKDVIIIAGRNHYPQDIEWTVERADPRIRRGCSACFALQVDGVERVVIAAEIDPRRGDGDLDALAVSLRAAVASHHGVRLHAVSFVQAGTIPKTTSGKIQRRACRDAFERETLDEVHRWSVRGDRASMVPGEPLHRRSSAPPEPTLRPDPPAALVNRCVLALRGVLDEPTLSVDLDAPLAHLGLDSVQVMELKAELEGLVGRAVPLATLRDARSLRELVHALDRREAPPPAPVETGDPWAEHVNPFVAAQLRALKLDLRYVRGEGCYVEDESGRRYLDVTAAYGALPFGFNPPEVWDAILDAARTLPPSLVQPSRLDAAGRLARALVDLAPRGLRYVTFANSGAEANEAAIKMVRAATGRMGIVSAESGFHGKTLGALSATGRTSYQRAFGAPAPGFVRVPFGDLAALEATLTQAAGEIAAVVLEVIQGEGGIRVAPDGYLRGVRALCDRHDVMLVIDEVQTGLGRTGSLFACEQEGVVPDVLTLAKALGGGLVPIGAVLSNARCFSEEFALRHSSTFAGNALAALVGLRSLHLLTRDDRALVRHVAACGDELAAGLAGLRARFPALVKDVRGRGFMHGVELTDDHGAFGRQGLLASMAAQGTLAYLLCSHLLHAEGVRIAPALLGSRVLRIEPPLIATREMCRTLLDALHRCFERLERCDTRAIVGHLVERESAPTALEEVPRRSAARPDEAGDEGRWGFVFHPLDHRSYADFDVSLAGYDEEALHALVDRLRNVSLRDTPTALLLGAGRVTSPKGARAYGELFAIPSTAAELHAMPSEEAVARVREAVCEARDRGARVVGLGAYTSIVTRNGAWLGDVGVPITTGNGLTVVAAVDVLLDLAARRALPLATATVAVVGATGSIGRAVALELAPYVGRMVLVGNPAHPSQAFERLHHVANDMLGVLHDTDRGGALAARVRRGDASVRSLIDEGLVTLCAEPRSSLTSSAIVVAATSSPHALLTAEQLGRGAIVCDISRPSNLAPGLVEARPDLLTLEGGVVALPPGVDLGVRFGLAPGLLYACMAETVLLALARRETAGTRGDELSRAHLSDLRALAETHGFKAVAARGGRPLEAHEITRELKR